MNIGLKIKELRNQNNVTQDNLAKAVGISTQAVSKWENGGLPDIELLPSIAKYFNVSIDFLFDIPSNNLENTKENLINYILNFPSQKERFFTLMELCWIIVNNIPGKSNEDLRTLKDINDRHKLSHMEVNQNSGIALMRIAKEDTFFFVAPKPEKDYNYLLINKDLCINAFNILSNKDTFDTLIFLNSRENINFTPNLLINEFSLDYDRVEEIINELKSLNFIKTTELEIDDKILKTYSLKKNPALIGLLAFIDLIVKRPNLYNCYYGNDDITYFSKA